MNLPEKLETDRLILRPHTKDDFEGFYSFLTNEVATQYLNITKAEQEKEQAMAFFAEMLESQGDSHPIFGLAIIEKGSRRYIGSCGLSSLVDGSGTETYLLFLPEFWGRGYATEVFTALSEYAFSILKIKKLVSFVSPGNHANTRVVEKMGMKSVGQEEHPQYSQQVERFVLKREDFFSM